jgi:hypothetical protein
MKNGYKWIAISWQEAGQEKNRLLDEEGIKSDRSRIAGISPAGKDSGRDARAPALRLQNTSGNSPQIRVRLMAWCIFRVGKPFERRPL